MKTVLSIFISFLLFGSALPQTAPDFSFTDTKGETHNLYASLDAGKTVVLDFFYVDCAPCLYWASSLQDLYNKWGSGYADVEIWAFSDKDENEYIETFAADSGLNFTFCGIDRGAVEVINNYDSIFGLSGYPGYSVICADKTISWDIWPLTAGMPEIDDKITACGATGIITSADGPDQEILIGCIWPNPAGEQLHLNLGEAYGNARQIQIRIYALNGSPVYAENTTLDKKEFVLPVSKLAAGMYYLVVMDAEGVIEKEKFIKL